MSTQVNPDTVNKKHKTNMHCEDILPFEYFEIENAIKKS